MRGGGGWGGEDGKHCDQGGGDGGDHLQGGLTMNDEQEVWNNEVFKIWKNSRLNWRSQNGVEEFEMEDDAQCRVYSPKGGSGEELAKIQTRERLRKERRLDNAWEEFY